MLAHHATPREINLPWGPCLHMKVLVVDLIDLSALPRLAVADHEQSTYYGCHRAVGTSNHANRPSLPLDHSSWVLKYKVSFPPFPSV
jgi:hypothetical protein